ncbi:polyphosphate kinase 1 [Olsenella sp. HMSC062G07]|uniref:polyphosphate kinase 1 n=1 Tax=Olsenella sp. HMSC062G07 TaxID=1739330 RepID=UPI0008A16993|nr:polyphosphate kinase 1 [Olsenella sp. HMSC062G07]OFK24333.1 polyphosphate kinase 1 [Olsenella sp. HMSC062G07]
MAKKKDGRKGVEDTTADGAGRGGETNDGATPSDTTATAEEVAFQGLDAGDGAPGKAPDASGDAKDADGAYDFSYTQNREVSWLKFDDRVLDEAFDESVPLFERLKFVSIFGSNLDEWFMIRIGGLSDIALLKRQPRDNKSNETPAEQIESVLSMLPPLVRRREEAFAAIESRLAENGLARVGATSYTDADGQVVAKHFDQNVQPILSPMIVNPRHPFPNLRNSQLYVVCSLMGAGEKGLLGIVEVPSSLERVVELPSTDRCRRYTLLEDVIISRLPGCFGAYQPVTWATIRVTRNADVDPDGEGVEEEEDYRQHMKKVLKKRQRLQPVRLELQGELDEKLTTFITRELALPPLKVTRTTVPLDLSYVFGLEDRIPGYARPKLLHYPFEPQQSPMVDASLPMRNQVNDHDVLLFYPYESMSPLLRLLREAAGDDDCISIKVTLYRVARQSSLCESLISAVESGKEVTVLMELRARFDEENNIAWADRLEHAGCTVIYGSEGYKCHSKICQITYHDKSGISRITCLGTGNFNEKTARLYSDFMLLTANEDIGEDGNTFFRNLSLGNLLGSYKQLGVAPAGLKPLVMRGLDREIKRALRGESAQVFMKMNSLTDRDVIDKIADACQAGVRMLMIVRGICCIRANVPGRTDGLVVRQIVGRFLEHARVYAFGVDADTIYLSSADMMTRNTERRVEIAYPVLDPTCRSLVMTYMNIQLADNAKSRQLTSEGDWEKVVAPPDAPHVDSQDLLLALAYRRSRAAQGVGAESLSPLAGIYPDMSRDQIRELVELPGIATYEGATAQPSSATGGREAEADASARDAAAQLVLGEARGKPAGTGDGDAGRGGGRLTRGLALIAQGLRVLFSPKD